MRTPASTYRLQVTEDFDLLEAAKTLTYLRDLGVDWVYLSPLLASESGSSHGYDVADHRAIDPSRGRASGLAALSSEARRLGMGVLVDIVPNHVGVAAPWENEWWWHVLTHGQESPYASAFDIDWDFGDGRVRIPVVGDDDLVEDPAGGPPRIRNLRVLAGELHYHDQRFPLAPGTAELGAEEDPDAVHARQHYELVSWRRADTDLNYRRFFAVNTLVAIRVEDPEWFDKSHTEIVRWFDEGLVDGLRVDHPDGLRDPVGYLASLAEATGHAYVLVEKILEPGEELPTTWDTAGTTGYDVLAHIDRLLTDPAGEQPLTELDTRLRGGQELDWHALVHDAKRAVADGMLHSEVRRIVRDAGPSVVEPVETTTLDDAVAELLACFPVYRSYLPEGREHLEQAFAGARRHRPDLEEAYTALEPVLFDGADPAALRFQQTSGMVMAKGVEDCSFYRYGRLTSLNEVGGDPSVFSLDQSGFFDLMSQRQEVWPQAMTAGSTHDTKRGEDVRARISVIAELPQRWSEVLDQLLAAVPLPDPAFGNLLWQAVVGCWPASRERLHAYAEKAMREAGDRTQWTAPDEAYEAVVHAAVDAAYDDPRVRALVEEVAAELAAPGWSNSLTAKLLTLTVPGVPDVYQGSELWEQSLVDPDNRRPVDYERRADLLRDLRLGRRPDRPEKLDDDGSAKLLLTHLALSVRRDRPELLTRFSPLEVVGEAAEHAVAFDRGGVVAVGTRLPVGLERRGGWGDTTVALPPGQWRDRLTGKVWQGYVALADLLAKLPVALLVTTAGEPERGRFDVWAPLAHEVALSVGAPGSELTREVPMRRGEDDWWTPDGPEPLGEVDYGYRIDGGDVVPDPRSWRQPRGVHDRSRTVDPAAFSWTDEAWTGRQLAGSVVYELHVGTFTPEGTLDAAITRLGHLREIGVDLVELMPVNAFNGEHGWGYDGVLWGAVHEPYGGPAAYARFVDACHAAGLGVVQDVVYNHFGPSGNYLPMFGPYLKAEGDNPWGAEVNLDGAQSAEVRSYVLDNVRRWLEDLHVDALRLDAVHALTDTSEVHLLEEIAMLAARISAQQRRPITVIAESDLNDPHLVTPREAGGYGLDAQWSDDFHHAVHVALTGETEGYYADFEPLSALAKVCEKGFFHDGTWSSFRDREHGVEVDRARLPAWRLVVCNQNHDQVGNRARGDRLAESLDTDQLALAAMLTLTGPFTPMLFMGEEWGASTPFAFFTSHPEPELGKAVSEGRLREFERMAWDADSVPDPQDPETFRSSKLDWDEAATGDHAVLLQSYRELAALRRAEADLTDPDMRRTSCEVDEDARWFRMERGSLVVVAALGDAATVPLPEGTWEVVWSTPTPVALGLGEVHAPGHTGAVLRRL
ncbi:malto-oligosyltrehalose synthase [Nocardioides marmoribigeumensis]|uniref:Malto-oligosyltrehalose trehalohydrolase n=1 Tax=Nocardioides marmoribigeumensis TaxID=433649 RepID=A0ABU2BVE8_9ACTN|nr:malto-oligosyltrehalose synthase [Nocardioides marmoribigeumensis]MDR7362241.1 malto-oligosyltrehalose synthase/malto-oligosyltrehalose trehalohydrolase [Nocardioides marmoribigeumensis]